MLAQMPWDGREPEVVGEEWGTGRSVDRGTEGSRAHSNTRPQAGTRMNPRNSGRHVDSGLLNDPGGHSGH